MRKILEELWRGNLDSQSRSFNRGTPYEEALEMICQYEIELRAMLNDNEKEAFEKYCIYKDELDQYAEEDIFITGFRYGARMIIESLHNNDGYFIDAIV